MSSPTPDSTLRDQHPCSSGLNPLRSKRAFGLLAIYAIILVAMSLLSPYFLSSKNFTNLLLASSTMGIIAMFTTMLMVGGGLDLSIGSTVALVGVIISHAQYTLGIPGAVAVGLAASVAIGLTNGLLVTRVGINPLITTLGMFSVVRGLAFVISGGLTETMFDPVFGRLGRGFIAAIPVPVIIFAVVTVACHVVMKYTKYGRAMYSIGGNPTASRLAGLPVKRYQLAAYVLSALSAGVAGVILTSLLGAGHPRPQQAWSSASSPPSSWAAPAWPAARAPSWERCWAC